ncbi:hypothetical protein PRZ48_011824 [Zasmidium cellare]|uniref:Uncharacterized protein n=1 Tax=Zasmidium cellare TaxID=395010 RepID=A0ABR0E7F5_ZASCE|nr:hypothetical protein PRZ48_011824 [Zasmidium cellare]
MPSFIAALSLLLPLALAQTETDARFYTDEGCNNFAIACTNLAENTCCSVSKGGTVLYSSSDFYYTASGMGVTFNGNVFSIQGTVANDCNIVTCGNIRDSVCCEADTALSGASYSTTNSKMMRKTRSAGGVAFADSYAWVEDDKSYYISHSNSTKMAAVEAMRSLGDFTNLGSFFKTHAEVVKSEAENTGKKAKL